MPAGVITLGVIVDYDGGGLGKGATITLTVNGAAAAHGRVERTVPFVFSMSGETLDVGVDTCSPVGPYPSGFPFTGRIGRIEIDLRSDLANGEQRDFEDGQRRGAVSQH